MIALNFMNKEVTISNIYKKSKKIFSTEDLNLNIEMKEEIMLKPFEGIIVKES